MPTAVVLTQVGGPDDQAAVKPYLQSFFSDPISYGCRGG